MRTPEEYQAILSAVEARKASYDVLGRQFYAVAPGSTDVTFHESLKSAYETNLDVFLYHYGDLYELVASSKPKVLGTEQVKPHTQDGEAIGDNIPQNRTGRTRFLQ